MVLQCAGAVFLHYRLFHSIQTGRPDHLMVLLVKNPEDAILYYGVIYVVRLWRLCAEFSASAKGYHLPEA